MWKDADPDIPRPERSQSGVREPAIKVSHTRAAIPVKLQLTADVQCRSSISLSWSCPMQLTVSYSASGLACFSNVKFWLEDDGWNATIELLGLTSSRA
jgi:hypothetical protein